MKIYTPDDTFFNDVLFNENINMDEIYEETVNKLIVLLSNNTYECEENGNMTIIFVNDKYRVVGTHIFNDVVSIIRGNTIDEILT